VESRPSVKLRIADELGDVPFTAVVSELLFEVFSQRNERDSTLVTSNLPFDEWTSIFGSERLTGALLDRFTHHVHILEMNGESFRLTTSKKALRRPGQGSKTTTKIPRNGTPPRKDNPTSRAGNPASPRSAEITARTTTSINQGFSALFP